MSSPIRRTSRGMGAPHDGGRRPRRHGCWKRRWRSPGRRAWWAVLVYLMGSAAASMGIGAHVGAAEIRAVDFMKHGNPAPVAAVRGAAATELPDGRSVVLAWLSGQRDYSLLVVDVDSGETDQFHHEGRARGRAFLLTEAGQFYAYGDSKLLVYDVHENELSIIEGPSRFGYAMAEGSDGTVYIALFPGANLLAYDPQTQALVDLGPMAEHDQQQFPRTLAIDDAGWVYAGYSRNIITAFDPETGERRVVADAEDEGSGMAEVYRGEDGAVYGRACARGLSHVEGRHAPWKRFEAGAGEALPEQPAVRRGPEIMGGNYTAVHRHFPDGRYLKTVNLESLEPYVEVASSEASEESQRVEVMYEAAGSYISALTKGPDGGIYGSTGSPRYVFRFDPETETFDAIAIPGGPWNEMTVQGGSIFAAQYASGELHRYEPDEPWDGEGTNPRTVAYGRNPEAMITRPYLLEAHPDGRRVIAGGYYDREGVSGGGLLIYDVESEETTKLSKHDLRKGHNPRSLAVAASGELVVGTTVGMRGRAPELATEARLLVLNEDYEVVHDTIVVDGARDIVALRAGPDRQRMYGLTRGGTFFVFDVAERHVVHKDNWEDYGGPAMKQAPRMMELADDGMFYVLFEEKIVQMDPATYSHRVIGHSPVLSGGGIVIRDDRLYYRHIAELWSARLDGFEPSERMSSDDERGP